MRISLVVTCCNYGDFLAATIPTNKALFDYAVVATTPEDKQTQKVCEYWNVHCIQVPAFHDGGGFRKGAGINAAIRTLKAVNQAEGWVVHADADIFFPPLTRELLTRADLDPTMLYGVDRLMCKSFEEWYAFLMFPQMQQENGAFVHLRPFELGVRVISKDQGYDGWVPIGFTQIWNPSVSGIWAYPEEHTTAGRGDMLFTKNWPRAKRAMIPEFIPVHLESEPAPMGANWAGRKTKLFGPTPVPEPVAVLPLADTEPAPGGPAPDPKAAPSGSILCELTAAILGGHA